VSMENIATVARTAMAANMENCATLAGNVEVP
jgi:hypothetical protein